MEPRDRALERTAVFSATFACCSMFYAALVLAAIVGRLHRGMAPTEVEWLTPAIVITVLFALSTIPVLFAIRRSSCPAGASDRVAFWVVLMVGATALTLEFRLARAMWGVYRVIVASHGIQSFFGIGWLALAGSRSAGVRDAASHWLYLSVIWSLSFIALWVVV